MTSNELCIGKVLFYNASTRFMLRARLLYKNKQNKQTNTRKNGCQTRLKSNALITITIQLNSLLCFISANSRVFPLLMPTPLIEIYK